MIRLELKPTEAIYFCFGENNITKIREFFTKKNHRYNKDEFKPGSEKAKQAEQEHLKVMMIPDHHIREIGEVTFKYGHQKLSFTLMEHTYDVPLRDYDDPESYCVTQSSKFLVENSYWGYGIVASYGELAQNINYQNLLRLELDTQLLRETHTELEEMPKPFSSLLLNKITEAKKELRTVRYYREYHRLGEAVVITDPFTNDKQVYSEKELTPIYEDMLDDTIFYDSSDERIEIKYGESYIDFHKRATAATD